MRKLFKVSWNILNFTNGSSKNASSKESTSSSFYCLRGCRPWIVSNHPCGHANFNESSHICRYFCHRSAYLTQNLWTHHVCQHNWAVLGPKVNAACIFHPPPQYRELEEKPLETYKSMEISNGKKTNCPKITASSTKQSTWQAQQLKVLITPTTTTQTPEHLAAN